MPTIDGNLRTELNLINISLSLPEKMCRTNLAEFSSSAARQEMSNNFH